MTIRVLHVIESFGKQADGVAEIVRLMAEQLAEKVDITIATSSVEGDFSQAKFNIAQIYLPPGLIALQGASRSREEFRLLVKKVQPDVIHIHGVFSPLQRIAIHVARQHKVPTLLSTHGMLESWLWEQKGWGYKLVKRAFWWTTIYPVLSNIYFVHAITNGEAKTLAKEFPRIPQIQIPNVIDLRSIKALSAKWAPERIFVFLGRVHPKKGVNLLVQAFKHANLTNDWRLVIAGPDSSPAYGQELRQLAVDLGVADRVDFCGPVYGDAKYILLGKAWVVVVPSFSEVIAIVNLEAAAVSTPTITTHATGLHDWEEGGGLLVDPKEDQLAQALSKVASWSLDERLKNGEKAHQFVKERYSWDVIVEKWIEAYKTISEEFAKC